jgi:hypothetical protein
MSLLEKRLKSKTIASVMPTWVSDKNATPKIYEHLNKLKVEKFVAVKVLPISQLKTKKNYQISAGELSRAAGIAKTTLISTSSYSKALKGHLDALNKEILQIRDARLHDYKNNLYSVKQRKKALIMEENRNLKSAYEALQKENASEQVKLILNSLSLPIRTKLGLK